MKSTKEKNRPLDSGAGETPKNIVKPVSVSSAKIDRDVRETVGEWELDDSRIRCREVNVYYGDKQAIRDVSLDIGHNEVIAIG